MRPSIRQPKQRPPRDSGRLLTQEAERARRRPDCLPETLLEPRPQSLPV